MKNMRDTKVVCSKYFSHSKCDLVVLTILHFFLIVTKIELYRQIVVKLFIMKFLGLSHADELKWRSLQAHDFTTVSCEFAKNEVMENDPNGLRRSAF